MVHAELFSVRAAMRHPALRRCLVLCAAVPAPAAAHGFGAAYNLPVPLELYNAAAAATLIISFLLVGVFWSPAVRPGTPCSIDISDRWPVRIAARLLPVLRFFSLGILLLCIATGFFGSRDPLRNFSPVFFWVIFVLVFSYMTALVGDAYAALNPFRTLAQLAQRVWRGGPDGRFRYPQALADWPALMLYLGFIWFELFSHRTPKSLATMLLAYTMLNLVGVYLVGRRNWFRHCEFFSVFFRLLALMAPLDFRRGEGDRARVRLRWPLAGLIQERPAHVSGVVFVLAMISTTAMDGLQATQWWVALFWHDPTGLLTALTGTSPMRMMGRMMPVYLAWGTVCLLLAPFVYLLAYLAALWLAKCLTRSSRPVLTLAMDFSYSLLPIALVYNITHYWTLISSHGLKIFSLISDPFGWRWDLFGTAMKFRAPILPDMGTVWHSQLGLILLGHILSVAIAHRIALRIWPSRRRALLSQMPVLALMVTFTVSGLWILAQPLTAILPR